MAAFFVNKKYSFSYYFEWIGIITNCIIKLSGNIGGSLLDCRTQGVRIGLMPAGGDDFESSVFCFAEEER